MSKNKPKTKEKKPMSTKPATMAQMEASPDIQAGNYHATFWFKILLAWLENKFPGSAVIIEQAAAFLPWSKLSKALLNALADYQAGKEFLVILQELLAEWLVIEPPENGVIRMGLKPGA